MSDKENMKSLDRFLSIVGYAMVVALVSIGLQLSGIKSILAYSLAAFVVAANIYWDRREGAWKR